MNRPVTTRPVYVLLHSPLVGGFTWSAVADQFQQRGLQVRVPPLHESPDSQEPYWKQHAASVAQALSDLPRDTSVVLVAHSGAGPLLPVIRHSLPNRVQAYVFVDAGLPADNATRLDLMQVEDPDWASQFQEQLERGERFPTWSSVDLQEIIPDEETRRQLVADLRPRGLGFFREPIPVFEGWPDAPCVYILFSPPYLQAERKARLMGWPTYTLEAGHFHMLVDSQAVADLILKAVYGVS